MASRSTPAIFPESAAALSVTAQEDAREGQRAHAQRVTHEARDLRVRAVAGDRREEIAKPAAGQAEANDAGAHVDEVASAHELDLRTGSPLRAQLVVALDRVRAERRAWLAPAVRANEI